MLAPAIDDDDLASDPARGVAEEVDRRVADVAHVSRAPQRNVGRMRLSFGREAVDAFGAPNRAGGDHVGADALWERLARIAGRK